MAASTGPCTPGRTVRNGYKHSYMLARKVMKQSPLVETGSHVFFFLLMLPHAANTRSSESLQQSCTGSVTLTFQLLWGEKWLEAFHSWPLKPTCQSSVDVSHLSSVIITEWVGQWGNTSFFLGYLGQETPFVKSKLRHRPIRRKVTNDTMHQWNRFCEFLLEKCTRLLLCRATFGKHTAGKPEAVKTIAQTTNHWAIVVRRAQRWCNAGGL